MFSLYKFIVQYTTNGDYCKFPMHWALSKLFWTLVQPTMQCTVTACLPSNQWVINILVLFAHTRKYVEVTFEGPEAPKIQCFCDASETHGDLWIDIAINIVVLGYELAQQFLKQCILRKFNVVSLTILLFRGVEEQNL